MVDAGFNELDIIPMGADKVFVRSLSDIDTVTVVEGAKDFFNLVFSIWARWDKEIVPVRRGAWVRLYGIPVHAWNEEFFKLCILDCGSYLRADSHTVDKIWFDYARILIATPLLEDSCLLAEGKISEASHSDNEEEHVDLEASNNVDVLLEKLVVEVESGERPEELQPNFPDKEFDIAERISQRTDNLERDPQLPLFVPCTVTINESLSADNVCEVADVGTHTYPNPNQRKRADSCPPGAKHSVVSGPWSWEWLHDHNLGDAGVIFSSNKRTKKGSSLKKVACMPIKDRDEVLKILRKNILRRREKSNSFRNSVEPSQGSSASITNDWEHWMVMHGNEQRAMEDVRGIGRVIGVQVKGVNTNRFRALSRDRKGVQVILDELLMEGEVWEGLRKGRSASLWGSPDHAFSFRPSVGASGGLLTLWNTSEVEVWSSTSREHVLWCHGRFTKSGEEFFLANVYAPCDLGAKQVLWASLSDQIQLLGRRRMCVSGDFNAVRCIEERRSPRTVTRSTDILPFNQFIDEMFFIDLPLSGRKFTWYKGDGHTMSRLDRFLLSEDWCLAWPNCVHVAQLRGLSDHCPLILSADEENWGPRSSRMLKCWTDVPGYVNFVRDKWNSFQVNGWGGFVLKEKLKMIKLALKEWHEAHVRNIPRRIDSLKVRLSDLDSKGEEASLSDEEVQELHGITLDIHSLSRLNASICRQQSRSRWLREGDANTKYFHSVLTNRRRGNTISSLQVNGVTTRGVHPIRQAVFTHFADHFKVNNVDRPRVENLHFRRLNPLECGSLIKAFSLEEVKAAVWDCDSYKSPGPDCINFGFIKDFWSETQCDIMRFISEFHRNGKLTKGLNATFIALIPKSNEQGYYTSSNDSSPHPEYLATMSGTPPKQAKQILMPENLNRPTIHYIKEIESYHI
ncbi:hypothetical protein TSUD_402850 [Trifolium subterraneum]|uniref:Uncharacterized protein n=1 Tax=Trifolium subterraneum TaxID=3900 RepID=A0A2Z6NR84_TRISU|nr:hypothetical protein TSUD_402850 [Trifolium subterraneum]